MVAERKLNIVIAAPDKNAGLGTVATPTKTVNYTGKTITMKF
jgi:hypothetical protein